MPDNAKKESYAAAVVALDTAYAKLLGILHDAREKFPEIGPWQMVGAISPGRGSRPLSLSRCREWIVSRYDEEIYPPLSTVQLGAILGVDHSAVVQMRSRIRTQRRLTAEAERAKMREPIAHDGTGTH